MDGSSGSFLVSMTRAAKATGAYWLDDVGTRMCVHPRYGTWTSFRALVVFHEEGTNGTNGTNGACGTTVPPSRHRHRRCRESRHLSPRPAPCPCMVTEGEIANARSIFEYALGASSSSSSSLDANDGTTTMGYGDTVGRSWEEVREYLRRRHVPSSCTDVPESIMAWIRLRDCYASGNDDDDDDCGWRYDAPQLLYHYTRDVAILLMELRRARVDERRARKGMN